MVKRLILPIGAALALAAFFVLSLMVGRVWIDPAVLFASLSAPKPDLAWLILFELRLPRSLLALLVGTSLGLSGAVLQGLLRNPLADPGLLGVTAGASLGAVVAIYFGLSASLALVTPVMGIIGAVLAAALTLAIGRNGTLTMILAGAAVTGLMGAGLSLALNFAPSPYAAYEITSWLLGSLADRSWDHLLLALPFMLVGWACLIATMRDLDALTLGEVQAESLGVNLSRTRFLALAGTALAVGSATAVCGAIGFIGLMAPHLVRPFVGHEPRRVLLPAAFVGAMLLLIADIAARLIPSSLELKLGVLTSLAGTPFFFWLVLRLRRMAPS